MADGPGRYALRGKTRLLEAVQMAGSFSPRANLKQVVVVRGDLAKPEVKLCDASAVLERGDLSQNIMLRNGDFVVVPRDTIGRVEDFIRLIRPPLEVVRDLFTIYDIARD